MERCARRARLITLQDALMLRKPFTPPASTLQNITNLGQFALLLRFLQILGGNLLQSIEFLGFRHINGEFIRLSQSGIETVVPSLGHVRGTVRGRESAFSQDVFQDVMYLFGIGGAVDNLTNDPVPTNPRRILLLQKACNISLMQKKLVHFIYFIKFG